MKYDIIWESERERERRASLVEEHRAIEILLLRNGALGGGGKERKEMKEEGFSYYYS